MLFQRNASLRSRVYGSPRGVSIEVAISDEGRHLRHFGSVLSRSTYPPTPEVRQRKSTFSAVLEVIEHLVQGLRVFVYKL